jgi:hypothetical protein
METGGMDALLDANRRVSKGTKKEIEALRVESSDSSRN